MVDEFHQYNDLSYQDLLIEAKTFSRNSAQKFIPRLCVKLEEEGVRTEEVKDIVKNDLKDTWSIATIEKFVPEKYKDSKKVKARKEGIDMKKEILEIAATENAEVVYKDDDRENQSEYLNSPTQNQNQEPDFNIPEAEESYEVADLRKDKVMEETNRLKEELDKQKERYESLLESNKKAITELITLKSKGQQEQEYKNPFNARTEIKIGKGIECEFEVDYKKQEIKFIRRF